MVLRDKYCYRPHLSEEETETEKSSNRFRTIRDTHYQPNDLSPPSAILPTHSLSQSSSAEPRLSTCVPEHEKRKDPTNHQGPCLVWPEPIDQ